MAARIVEMSHIDLSSVEVLLDRSSFKDDRIKKSRNMVLHVCL
jgi:hypothetical protein